MMDVGRLGSDKPENLPVCSETLSSEFPDNEGQGVESTPGEVGSDEFRTCGSLL